MHSRLYMTEAVENKDRKFGSAKHYLPVEVVKPDGSVFPVLLTEEQIMYGAARAIGNPEDVPRRAGFWSRLWRAIAK